MIIHLKAWSAIGANPTPMAFSELFTAMQQGTVDGEENPIGIIQSNRFYGSTEIYLPDAACIYSVLRGHEPKEI